MGIVGAIIYVAGDMAGDEEGVRTVLGEANPDHTNQLKKLAGDVGTIAPLADWPAACDFIRKNEIRSVLPQVDKINVSPVISLSRNGIDPNIKLPDGEQDKAVGMCVYSMRLPGEVASTTIIRLKILGVARADVIRRNYEALTSRYRHLPMPAAGARCAVPSIHLPELVCAKGALLFSITGYSTAIFEEMEAPYVWFWRDRVLPEFIKIIAAKIP